MAEAQAGAAHARTEAATARTEAANARAELGQARADVAEAKAGVAEARAGVADARSEASAAQAEAAAVAAEMAGAVAQRDAAVARAQEVAADREALLNHFKVVSNETLERQGATADAAHENRLKATAELMAPVREQLGLLSSRLIEVEKERVEMSVDLRAQVQTVRQTGETLRRETSALVTALRKPQIRGSWGETQLKRVAEIAGMLDRCDFELQHSMASDDKTLRPDMRVNLAEGKHVFVDSKVPLSAFLEAAEAESAEDDVRRTEALVRYGRHVRTHVDQLSTKQYWKGGETPEFVVLFLPSEAFFAAALEQVPDLYDYAARRNVVHRDADDADRPAASRSRTAGGRRPWPRARPRCSGWAASCTSGSASWAAGSTSWGVRCRARSRRTTRRSPRWRAASWCRRDGSPTSRSPRPS